VYWNFRSTFGISQPEAQLGYKDPCSHHKVQILAVDPEFSWFLCRRTCWLALRKSNSILYLFRLDEWRATKQPNLLTVSFSESFLASWYSYRPLSRCLCRIFLIGDRSAKAPTFQLVFRLLPLASSPNFEQCFWSTFSFHPRLPFLQSTPQHLGVHTLLPTFIAPAQIGLKCITC